MFEARDFQVQINGAHLRVESGNPCGLEWVEETRSTPALRFFRETDRAGSSPGETDAVHAAYEFLFRECAPTDEIAVQFSSGVHVRLTRAEFYQRSGHWQSRQVTVNDELRFTETDGRRHPRRPELVPGLQYRRFIPNLGKTITFRSVDPERDLERFHRWHHQPSVSALWDLNHSREDLHRYLRKGLEDPHQIPLIAELDGEAFGYFEVYWAAEDRIGPYYAVEAFDRGFHFLIGERRYLGAKNTDAVLRSIMHFIFLEDPRTQRIVAEPRADNRKVLRYVQITPGWRFIKEFDFPHKRAALLMAKRSDFFGEGAP